MDKLKFKARARYTFAVFLGERKLRCTPERLFILDVILEHKGAFTAAELLALCAASPGSLTVSRATVFNTLPLLVESGLLLRHSHERHVSYQIATASAQNTAREHLVCVTCGKIKHLKAPALEQWVESQHFRDFTGRGHDAVVYIYGQCARCRRRQSARQNN